MVVSEKALVKQLQQELARMENELRNLGSVSSAGSDFFLLLREKEEVIAKVGFTFLECFLLHCSSFLRYSILETSDNKLQMEEQMKELKWQRDVAQSRVENLLKSTADERSSRMDERSMLSSTDFDADLRRRSYDSIDLGQPSIINNLTERNLEFLENSEEDDFLLDDNTPQFSRQNLYDAWEEMVQIKDQKKEDACKEEVGCIETEGEQINGEESYDAADDIVDKKAVLEVLSPTKEETLSATEYQHSYNSFMGNEKAKKENMEISAPAEKENDGLPLRTMDVEVCLNAKPETHELTLNNSDLDVSPSVEAQESVKEDEQMTKEERRMSPFTKQVEQWLKKEGNAQSERQSKEDWELNTLPETVQVDLISEEKWDNKQHQEQDADKEYEESSSICNNIGTDHVDNNTYIALKEKVKEMQKKIEYLMSMHTAEQQQSPSFRRDYKSPEFFTTKRSISCRENRSPHWFENLDTNSNTSPSWTLNAAPEKPISKTSNTTSISFDSGSSMSSTPIDAHSLKDSDLERANSFQEFVAGLEEMARQHHSVDSTPELDYGFSFAPTVTERMEIKPESPANSTRGDTNALPNPQNRNEESTDAISNQSEREQANDRVS